MVALEFLKPLFPLFGASCLPPLFFFSSEETISRGPIPLFPQKVGLFFFFPLMGREGSFRCDRRVVSLVFGVPAGVSFFSFFFLGMEGWQCLFCQSRKKALPVGGDVVDLSVSAGSFFLWRCRFFFFTPTASFPPSDRGYLSSRPGSALSLMRFFFVKHSSFQATSLMGSSICFFLSRSSSRLSLFVLGRVSSITFLLGHSFLLFLKVGPSRGGPF